MATDQRYVDTDVAPGGDGTSGDPFASLSEWEATIGASNIATDDYIVDCCGVAADTTAVVVDFATNITTGSITIRGNRSDPAGFYDGNLTISDQHYRLAPASTINTLDIVEANTTVDGMQVVSAHTGANGHAVRVSTTGLVTVRKCRVLNSSGCDFGIGNQVQVNGSRTYENNLIVGFEVAGIVADPSTFGTSTYNCYHNTVYGGGAGDVGIRWTGRSGATTVNIVGNAIANTAGDAISIVAVGSSTVNSADNATEDSTGAIAGISPAAAWTSPGTSASSKFTVTDTNSPLYQVVDPAVVTDDITDTARGSAPHSAGAFELLAGGGAVTLTIADATHGHTADGGLVLTQQHQLAIAEATHAHSADNLTLSTESALAIADALHAHTADGGLVLTQQHVLAVADALHAHGVDNLTLLAGDTLAIAEAVHAHLADNLDLTQAHVLAIMEAIHAHTVDNVVLGLVGAELPPGHLLRVPGECRLLVVPPESRVLQVH